MFLHAFSGLDLVLWHHYNNLTLGHSLPFVKQRHAWFREPLSKHPVQGEVAPPQIFSQIFRVFRARALVGDARAAAVEFAAVTAAVGAFRELRLAGRARSQAIDEEESLFIG